MLETTMKRVALILRIDSGAGLAAGIGMIALSPWLAALYGWPGKMIFVMGLVNLSYGAFSGFMAYRFQRDQDLPLWSVQMLVFGNIGWGFVCAGLVWWLWNSATVLGLGILVFEGVFVAGLGLVELRQLVPAFRVRGAVQT